MNNPRKPAAKSAAKSGTRSHARASRKSLPEAGGGTETPAQDDVQVSLDLMLPGIDSNSANADAAPANEENDRASADVSEEAGEASDTAAAIATDASKEETMSASGKKSRNRGRTSRSSSSSATQSITRAAVELPPLTPALAVIPQLLLKAQGVRVAFFDVDGVLTDGGLFFGDTGETLKRFNTLDGHGIKLLAKVGIVPAVVTGRDSLALRHRLSALGITHVRYGTENKRPAAEAILAELGLDWSHAAWIGDDWPDLPAMRRCAFACAPANAHAEVKAIAHHVTKLEGGQGAAREFCDLLLVASGRYVELLQEYAT